MRHWTWIAVAAGLAAVGLVGGEVLAGKPGSGGGGGGDNTTPPDFAYWKRDKAGRNELWVIQDDATGATRIVPGGLVSKACWSPDGTRLAFVADFGTGLGRGVYVVNVDGTGLTRLTSHSGGWSLNVAWCPQEAPDGTEWLAICEDVDPTAAYFHEISLVSLDGTRVPVTAGLDIPKWHSGARLCSWVSGGQRLLTTNGKGVYRLLTFSYDSDGRLVLPTATSGVRDFASDHWNQDSECAHGSDRMMVHSEWGLDPNGDLWIVDFTDPDSLVYTQVTATLEDGESLPCWSPDDEEILFYNRHIVKEGGGGKGSRSTIYSSNQFINLSDGSRREFPTFLYVATWRPNLP